MLKTEKLKNCHEQYKIMLLVILSIPKYAKPIIVWSIPHVELDERISSFIVVMFYLLLLKNL